MNLQQAMSYVRHALPDFDDHAGSAALCAKALSPTIDVFDFASYIVTVLEKHDDRRTRAIFGLLENFLAQGSPDLRDWVASAIEALQGLCAWRRQGTCAFATLLGRQTRILWDRLDIIRRASSELDLSDCSVFEAEILTWRFARERSRSLAAA
jgi:hypothetical protein